MKEKTNEVTDQEVKTFYEALKKDTEAAGYHLNPDEEFTKDLVRSLLINERRYGYQACPCRLSTGVKQEDRDIICPCYYRDRDIDEYGSCYCGLYVSDDVEKGKKQVKPIPERRPPKTVRMKKQQERDDKKLSFKTDGDIVVWRCKVCGYLCARNQPPERCPICKATKDRFEIFST